MIVAKIEADAIHLEMYGAFRTTRKGLKMLPHTAETGLTSLNLEQRKDKRKADRIV